MILWKFILIKIKSFTFLTGSFNQREIYLKEIFIIDGLFDNNFQQMCINLL